MEKLTTALNFFGGVQLHSQADVNHCKLHWNMTSGKLLQEEMPVFMFPCARGGVSQEESRKAENCGWVQADAGELICEKE